MKRSQFLVLFSLLTALPLAYGQKHLQLSDGWTLQSSCAQTFDGASVSSPQFNTDSWIKTSVPATVLAAQYAAGKIPDPYYGSNMRQLPGAYIAAPGGEIFENLPMPENSPYRCSWWYRTTFHAEAAHANEHQWLHFGGINYRARLWLNGKQFADDKQVAGAYRTYDFDVTALLHSGQENVLAVEVFAPTEKDLGINWVDWNPCPPDKDMGLWGEVTLTSAPIVTVRSPMVSTHIVDASAQSADLTVIAELDNASDRAVRGTVNASLAGVDIAEKVELSAHEHRTLVLDPAHYAKLHLEHAQLWWPYQMGKPHLEALDIRFTEDGGATSSAHTEFGIREITSEYTANGSRLYRINGKPILIRGAGWSQDMLLRTDATRLTNQIRMVRAMNLNTIRLEGKLETEDFFKQTDREGILVMLGWCCCDHWEHWKNWTPDDLNIARESLRSQMLRLRQHASLLVWLNGSDNPPPANVETAYLKVEQETHWPNPVLSSASGTPTSVTGPSGVKMSGPYDYVAPSYWYVDQHNGGAFGFNTETGPGPAIVSLASRQKFLPDPEAWPPTDNWRLHNGGGEFATLKVFDEAMAAIYGTPQSAADYERIASAMAYDSERAMFESYSRNKYNSTGVIQWMLNNAWPSMIWHLYDYYLDAGSGYYATRKACEPVHIQYSYDDHSVIAVNSSYQPTSPLQAHVEVHNLAWKQLYTSDAPLHLEADSVQRMFALPDSLFNGPDRIFFVDLKITDSKGEIVSRNFYWVPGTLTTFDWPRTDFTHTPALRHEDLNALRTLPAATIDANVEWRADKNSHSLQLHLHNTSSALAFQTHAAVRTVKGDLIAPAFWSDNWIALAPGESITLNAELPSTVTGDVSVIVDGWNVATQTLTLKDK